MKSKLPSRPESWRVAWLRRLPPGGGRAERGDPGDGEARLDAATRESAQAAAVGAERTRLEEGQVQQDDGPRERHHRGAVTTAPTGGRRRRRRGRSKSRSGRYVFNLRSKFASQDSVRYSEGLSKSASRGSVRYSEGRSKSASQDSVRYSEGRSKSASRGSVFTLLAAESYAATHD